MDKESMARKVISQVSGVEPSQLEPEMELVADLGLDSAKALELLVELEERLDHEIDDQDAARLNTVGDILNFVRKLSLAPA